MATSWTARQTMAFVGVDIRAVPCPAGDIGVGRDQGGGKGVWGGGKSKCARQGRRRRPRAAPAVVGCGEDIGWEKINTVGPTYFN